VGFQSPFGAILGRLAFVSAGQKVVLEILLGGDVRCTPNFRNLRERVGLLHSLPSPTSRLPVQLEMERVVLPVGQWMEHEEATEALHSGRESRHPEAAIAGQRADLEVCDELGLEPMVFYRWQKEFFEKGGLLSSRKRHRTTKPTGSGSPTQRRTFRRRTRFWPSSWRITTR
jgi:hypothetical protein